jgi:hypothetical protein
MREKVERGALGGNRLPRASEVRLTEFDPSRSDGYVRRLDREAISFFFTNFLEEVLGGDLWKMFARFGRVGEVYIPQKLNKWGCRFGFVKYMEVKDVSVLERKLSDLWMGSFKLQVNISRFAKRSSSSQQQQQQPVHHHPDGRLSLGFKETQVQPGRSYKTVLEAKTSTLSLKQPVIGR